MDNTGKTIHIYGIKPGRIEVTAWLMDTEENNVVIKELASYEAIVVTNRKLIFRVQLLHLGVADDPQKNGALTRTVTQASNQIAIANIYLRQIGVQLVPDTDVVTQPTDPTMRTTLIAKGSPGYFQAIKVDPSLVVDVKSKQEGTTIRLGDRPKVLQITYITSVVSTTGDTKGRSIGYPGSKLTDTFKLAYRIAVDDMLPRNSKTVSYFADGRKSGTDANVWGLVITNDFGSDPDKDAQVYAQGLAHEIGHILDLKHRYPLAPPPGQPVDPFPDGQDKPGSKNLLYPTDGLASEDLDLAQLLIARNGKALQP